MKLLRTSIFSFILIFFISVNAQVQKSAFIPSVYFTNGSYTNGNSSKSVSIYNSFLLNGFDYITLGYDMLNIENPLWDYDQNYFVINGFKNVYPFYFSLGYAHIKGDFKSINHTNLFYSSEFGEIYGFKQDADNYYYEYSDFTNIYSASIKYNYNLFYFGGSAVYLNSIGFKDVSNIQLSLSFDWLISPKLTLTVAPYSSGISDGRNLYSVESFITYRFNNKFNVTAGGFAGERAYYYNPDYLIVFNQIETQKYLLKLKGEFKITPNFNLNAIFQKTKFSGYQITYLTAGISYYFSI